MSEDDQNDTKLDIKDRICQLADGIQLVVCGAVDALGFLTDN